MNAQQTCHDDYSLRLFYFMNLFDVILFITFFLIDMSSFINSINVIFCLSLSFLGSLNLNQLNLSYGYINCSHLTITKLSQVYFPPSSHKKELPTSLSEFSSFKSFLSLYFHLFILIFLFYKLHSFHEYVTF